MPVTHGLPRKPLAATTVTGLAIFLLLAVDVTVGGVAPRVDAFVDAWLTGVRSPAIARAGDVLAMPADNVVVAVLLAIGCLACVVLGRLWHGVFLGGAASIGFGIVVVAKATVARARPILDYEGSLAFPSGHAAKAVIVYALLLIVLADAYRHRTRFRDLPPAPVPTAALAPTAGVIALVIGLGRLAEGVHWFTDVLAGWAFGAGWVAAMLLVASAATGAGSDDA